MSITDTSARSGAFSFTWLLGLIIGGLIAVIAWEFYARGVSPVFFGGGSVVPRDGSFAAMVAGLVGKEQIPGLALHPDALVAMVSTHFGFPISNDLANPIMEYAIGGEVFTITEAVIAHLVVGALLAPLVFMLIIRPILFFLPWIILGPLFGALMFVAASVLLTMAAPNSAPLMGLLEGSQLGLSSLIGHMVYGLFLAFFARIFAGR